jgi:glycosyltransferase involved in cell wall biosynthesis
MASPLPLTGPHTAAVVEPPSTDARPALSVIVPSVNGPETLLECLDALAKAEDVALEVLVIDRCGETLRQAVHARFPHVRVLAADPATSIPQLRAIGFRSALADHVAVIEDHVIVGPTWARQLLAALAEGWDVVGGSVSNAATASAVDWAAFLCEYSHLLPPLPSSRLSGLAGNNVVYRRTSIDRYAALVSAGKWENYLHTAMQRDGLRLTCRADIVVAHKQHYRVSEYLRQRYLFARSYAGIRRLGMPLPARVLFAVGAVALPPVLLVRIARQVFGKRRHRIEFLRALPLIAVFVCAWAAGEAVGYACGPGDALSHVK